MANSDLNIWIRLRDEVSPGMRRLQSQFQSFTKSMQSNWLALASKVYLVQQAIMAVNRVTGTFINSASRQEDAMNRLRNAIQLNGEDAERLVSQYSELAKEIQKSTRYGDEAVEELMQQLISVGGVTEENMKRATMASINFASATGRDLKTAALTVGKAMTGFTGELSRYGIILDQNIPATEKAQKALEAMEKQFGGMAQRDIDTFSGTVKQLGNNWGDLTEEVGKFVTENEDVREFIKNLSKDIANMAEAMNKVRKYREALTKTEMLTLGYLKVNPLAQMFGLDDKYQQVLKAKMDKYADDMGITVKTFWSIAEDENEKGKDDFENAQKAMTEFAKQSARNIQDAYSNFFFDAFKGELKSLQDIFTSFGNATLQTISNLMAQLLVMKMFEGTKLGTMMGFATGTPYVPETGIYQLHKGERVVPAHENNEGGGSGVNITLNQVISAWDVEDVYRNRKMLSTAMVEEIKRNAPIRDAIKRYT